MINYKLQNANYKQHTTTHKNTHDTIQHLQHNKTHVMDVVSKFNNDNKLQTAHDKLHTTTYIIQTTNYILRTTSYKLQITKYKQQTSTRTQ